MMTLLFCALLGTLIMIDVARSSGDTRHTEVHWDFRKDQEGWAVATSAEMEAEVYVRGEKLYGSIIGRRPHFDSPPFVVSADDKHHVVLRMSYTGAASAARVRVRRWQPQYTVERDHHDTEWSPTNSISADFKISNDGNFHIYYVPFYLKLDEATNITQLRLYPAIDSSDVDEDDISFAESAAEVRPGDSFILDWVRISKAPTIQKVEGCTRDQSDPRRMLDRVDEEAELQSVWSPEIRCRDGPARDVDFHQWCGYGVGNKYFETADFVATDVSVAATMDASAGYSASYNCLREGGERITITGRNFGESHAIVSIDGEDCTNVVHRVPETVLECTVPRATIHSEWNASHVIVKNGRLQGLWDDKPYLAYAMPPRAISRPKISNVAARSIDIDWEDPPYWIAVTVTGYLVQCHRESAVDNRTTIEKSIVYGNVTHVTVIGLEADSFYRFTVAALVEDQVFSERWLHVDLYGRRDMVSNAVVGDRSPLSERVRTLRYDFVFDRFDANSTLNHSSSDPRNSDGHIGIFAGEGHYGLAMVGDTSVENCNASAGCCDNFFLNENGSVTCGSVSCSGIGVSGIDDVLFRNGVSEPHSIASNIGTRATIEIRNATETRFFDRISLPCGPALRLTSSIPRASGAAWYRRKMQVREGFDTIFTFRLSNPSQRCLVMDDVYTNCRSRGSDGFAFIIQNKHSMALGSAGRGLGYDGIENSVAVEFDSWFNPDLLDPYENHVSVHTRGWRFANSANESFSLGHSVEVANFADGLETDGVHTVRIVYNPVFDEQVLWTGRFVASPHVAEFMENADFENGGMSDWATGMGTLSIYFDDLVTPLLIVPLNLAATLKLDDGRTWVGFTASSGDATWQVHDILSWNFLSSRIDPYYVPPIIVNGEGAHICASAGDCVHE